MTLRENTERPVTCELGSNRIAGTDPERVYQIVTETLEGMGVSKGIPPLWDGQAARRIAEMVSARS